MGYGKSRHAVKKLRAAIDAGTLKCETLTRKQHIFDLRDFPKTSRNLIGPNWP